MRKSAIGVATAVAVLVTGTPSHAQTVPPPAAGVERDAHDPEDGGNPGSPVLVLPPVIDSLEQLRGRGDVNGRDSLGKAAADVRRALEEYTGGSTDIRSVVGSLAGAARDVQKVRPGSEGDSRQLAAAAGALSGVSRTLAVNLVDRAARAGVKPGQLDAARTALAAGDAKRAAGDHGGAAQSYAEGIAIGSGGLHFDLDTFEQKIREMGPLVGGYAYTINVNEKLARHDADGWARTGADAPATPHSPDKEQFLASVSKTITGVAMLRALQDAGVSVDSPVDEYLPESWARGLYADTVTFRDLLTHRSGFADVGWTYQALRDRWGQSFPVVRTWDYENANFGLMRILIPRLDGPLLLEEFLTDEDMALAHALSFEEYVRTTILQPIGIDGRCRSTDTVDTRYYNFPPDDQPGYDEPDRLLECGGIGWFLSSDELGAFMAHLRYTETLLSAATRKAMDTGFLGWADPTKRSYVEGVFGVYHSHGGDWSHGPGEAHACIMKFHTKVEASVVINSERGFDRTQCEILRDAYDASWVA